MALTPAPTNPAGYHNTFHHAFVAEAQQFFGDHTFEPPFVPDRDEMPVNDNGWNLPTDLDDFDAATVPADHIQQDIQKPCYGYNAQGDTFYRHNGEGLWFPAYKHVDIRRWLLEDADLLGMYDISPEHGKDALDRTSFLPAQKTWGSDRPHRPAILFTHNPTADRSSNQHEVQPMWRYGRMVIGFDDLPIKNYRNMPDTISTAVEGYRMEAIEREDIRINHRDFRARMLPLSTNKAGTVVEPPVGNTLSARMRRFRNLACLYCWGLNREGSDLDREFVEKKLPGQCKHANSTQDFRDLYEHELVERELLTFGRCLSRAGGRGVQAAVRNKRRDNLQTKYDRLLQEHKEAHGQLAIENTDDQEDGGQEDFEYKESALENGLEENYVAVHDNFIWQENVREHANVLDQGIATRNYIESVPGIDTIRDQIEPPSRKRKELMQDENESADPYTYETDDRALKRAQSNATAHERTQKPLYELHQRLKRTLGTRGLQQSTQRLAQQINPHASLDTIPYDGNAPKGVKTSGLQLYVSEHPSTRAQDARMHLASPAHPSIPRNTSQPIHIPLGSIYNNPNQSSSTDECLASFSSTSTRPTHGNKRQLTTPTDNQQNNHKRFPGCKNPLTGRSFTQQGVWMNLIYPSQRGSEHPMEHGSTQTTFKELKGEPAFESDEEIPFDKKPANTDMRSLPGNAPFDEGSLKFADQSLFLDQSGMQHSQGDVLAEVPRRAQTTIQKNMALPNIDNVSGVNLDKFGMTQVGGVSHYGQSTNTGSTRRLSYSGIEKLSGLPENRDTFQGMSQILSTEDTSPLPHECDLQLRVNRNPMPKYVPLGVERHAHTSQVRSPTQEWSPAVSPQAQKERLQPGIYPITKESALSQPSRSRGSDNSLTQKWTSQPKDVSHSRVSSSSQRPFRVQKASQTVSTTRQPLDAKMITQLIKNGMARAVEEASTKHTESAPRPWELENTNLKQHGLGHTQNDSGKKHSFDAIVPANDSQTEAVNDSSRLQPWLYDGFGEASREL